MAQPPQPPWLCFAGPTQLCVTWCLDDARGEAAGLELVFELQYAPLRKLDATGAAVGSHKWVSAPWNGVMDLQAPRVIVSDEAEPEPEAARELVPHWTAIVEGLEPDTPYVFRTRVLPDSDWCVPSEPLLTLPSPPSATATWTDGSAAVGAAALDRNSGSASGGGMPSMLTVEQLLQKLQDVVTDNDSPVPEETKRAILGTILLSEAESDGQLSELAGQWLVDSLAASAPGAAFKGKVKTLHFITEVLARRWGVTTFRQAVHAHGERTLVELTGFTCPDDPTHGSKPTEWVRAGARRTLQMLQDRLVDVSPKGEFKVAARKKHTSKIELRSFQRVRWAFRLATTRGEIAFCARLSVEMNNGWDTSAIIVEPQMLSAADGSLTGEYTAGDAFQRCLVTFEWDNTASKLSSRTISYRLEISMNKEAAASAAARADSEAAAQPLLPEGVPAASARDRLPGGADAAGGSVDGGGGAFPLPVASSQSQSQGSGGFSSPRPRLSPRPPAAQQQQRIQTAEARRTWLEEWLPKWEATGTGGAVAAIKDSDRSGRRMRGLLNNGVPPALRARVWSLAVGNVLEITKDQFEIMVATAKATADVTAEENGRVATTREMIATDLHRTVGKIGFERFAIPQQTEAAADAAAADAAADPPAGDDSDGEEQETLSEPVFVGALKDVLEAFMHFKPEAGYTQGLSFLVATLLIHTATAPPIVVGGLHTLDDEEDRDEDAVVCSDHAEPDAFTAFRLMANLLEDSALMTLFALDGEQMQVLFAFFNDLFAAALPALHAHFAMHDIEPQLYLVEWIFTLFSKCLPPQVAGWIWDHICIVGEHYIFSVRTYIKRKARDAYRLALRFTLTHHRISSLSCNWKLHLADLLCASLQAALGLLQSLQPQLLLLEDFTLATLLKDVVRARMQCEGGHSEAE